MVRGNRHLFTSKYRELNIRDLGGIPLPEGRGSVPSGLFLRSGKLGILTNDECANLCQRYKVGCVIDLRTPVESAEFPDVLPEGVDYLQIPLLKDAAVGISHETGSDPMTILRNLRKQPEKLKEMIPDFKVLYADIVTDDYSRSQLDKVVLTLKNNAEKGICTLFHCTAGKDRTGIVSMALLKSYGVSDEEIIKDYMRTNRNAFWPTIKKCLGIWLLTRNWNFVRTGYRTLMADRKLIKIAIENLNSRLILVCALLCVMHACAQTNSNDIVVEGETPVRVSDAYSFTEGPAVDAKGDVYFTDQPNNRIYRWDCMSGEITLFTDQSGRSNGLYFDAQGNLIACADMDNQLWSFDMEGHSEILITDFGGRLLNGPNDVWISKDGGYYLTDPYFKRDYWERDPARQQPVEGLYYLAPGAKQLIMLDSTLNQPNGIVGTPDGKQLYVAEAKANRILKYDIQPDGYLTNRQVFADMGSDGMTIDDRGNIYLTGDGVTVFDKNGQKIAHFPIPEDWTANVCFGGKERNILFITASKSVYTLKMLVHGVK